MPFAVVDVPTIGTLRSLATGPAANISFDSVGPRISGTLAPPISLRTALIAWSLLPARILVGDGERAAEHAASLVHFVQREIEAVLDGEAVLVVRAGQDLDRADRDVVGGSKRRRRRRAR